MTVPVPAESAANHGWRRSIVVLAGDGGAGDRPARALARSLRWFGVEALYLGREDAPDRIAAAAAEARADAVELCVAGSAGVQLARALLRALREIERGDVSIVVHRVG